MKQKIFLFAILLMWMLSSCNKKAGHKNAKSI